MQFHCGLGGKIQCAVEENAEALDRVRERDCGIIKLNGVDRNRDSFCLVPMSIASVFSLFS